MIHLSFDVEYTQAANCWFCLHVGTTVVWFGSGRRPRGYGARLELFTPRRRFRYSKGVRVK